VLSFFLQSSDLGLAHPLNRRRVRPPNLWSGGKGTLACGRGVGGVPIQGTFTVVLYLFKSFVALGLVGSRMNYEN
jgi:hypothetical protein